MAQNLENAKTIKGLKLFIQDLRRNDRKEEETKRVNKELAKIRRKLNEGKPLNGYHKKKYVCKLIYIFLLGYKYDFGHILAINLLSSNAYSEKQIGYLFISVVMGEETDLIQLVINAIKSDLSSPNEVFQNLALQFISNSTSLELVNSVENEVVNFLLSSNTKDCVMQTAALALLQIHHIKPDLVLGEFQAKTIIRLMWHQNLGIVTAVAGLLEFLVMHFTSQYEYCVQPCIIKLNYIISYSSKDIEDYAYYSVTSPWITVKLLRILQNYPVPSDIFLKSRLVAVLEAILLTAKNPPKTKKVYHNNAKLSVIFEAISLIIRMEFGGLILSQAIIILRDALYHKEANYRFMALDLMTQLASNTMYLENVNLEWNSVRNVLKSESDINIKKRTIDLLYTICTADNVKFIVNEILHFFKLEDSYSDEIIHKTIALNERLNIDGKWYFDVILTMLQICGNTVSESVWHAVVNTVVTNNSIQKYAARKSFIILMNTYCKDVVIKIAGYILGEFGFLIAKYPESSPLMQLRILKNNYLYCSPSTKAILLTAFMKLLNSNPDLKSEIQSLLTDRVNIQSKNEEIQQRAIEYLKLSETSCSNLIASVLQPMPPSLAMSSGGKTVATNK